MTKEQIIKIIAARFGRNQTLQQIGDAFGISSERVRQLLVKYTSEHTSGGWTMVNDSRGWTREDRSCLFCRSIFKVIKKSKRKYCSSRCFGFGTTKLVKNLNTGMILCKKHSWTRFYKMKHQTSKNGNVYYLYRCRICHNKYAMDRYWVRKNKQSVV